jgi:hypothetical protein
MSKKRVEKLPPGWVQEKLAALRQQAAEPGQWPESADRLLALLEQQSQLPDTDESDDEMLSLIVHEAQAGVDIATQYAPFYQKMLANPRLFQAFLDALHVLETDEEGTAVLPQPASRDLSFLHQRASRPPQIQPSTAGAWRLTWQLFQEQLRLLLFPTPEPGYRRSHPFLEDESFILLQDEVTVDGRSLELLLEAVRPVEQPERLRLQVIVAAADDQLPSLTATITWGRYMETAALDAYGRAHFPPLSLADILDDAGQLQRDDLQLVLEIGRLGD